MGIRLGAAIIVAQTLLCPVLSERANATTLTETGSFAEVVSVANGSSSTDQITLAPFDPSLGTLTNTSVTITTDATFNGFANVPSLFPGGLNSSATTTVSYNLSSYGLASVGQQLFVQDTCPGPCQGISQIGTFSQSQTTTATAVNPIALGGTIPVNISSAQQSFGGTIVGTQAVNGTASVTFTYQPSLSATLAAQLSKLAYLPLATIQSGNLPPGYVLPPGFTAIAALNDVNGVITGEHAVAFQGPDHSIAVAFEGTAPGTNIFDQQTWTNTGVGGGPLTSSSLLAIYIPQVENFLGFLKTTTGLDVSHLTGYSLGGGIAEILGSVSGIDTVTFNAPGGKPALETLQNLGLLQNVTPPAQNTNIRDYRTLGDIISLLPGVNSQLARFMHEHST